MNSVTLQDTKLIYRNLLHSYTYNKLPERAIMKIKFTIASERMKHLGTNLINTKDSK